MIIVNAYPGAFTKEFYNKGLHLLSEEQAAMKCSIGLHELAKMRERGEGPSCLCFEGTGLTWLYPVENLEAWLLTYQEKQRDLEESARKLMEMMDN